MNSPYVLTELSIPDGRPWITFSAMNDQRLINSRSAAVSSSEPSELKSVVITLPLTRRLAARQVEKAAELPSPALVGNVDETSIRTPGTTL